MFPDVNSTLSHFNQDSEAQTQKPDGWYQDKQDLGIGYVVKGNIESPFQLSAVFQLWNLEVEHLNELEQWRTPANGNASLGLN